MKNLKVYKHSPHREDLIPILNLGISTFGEENNVHRCTRMGESYVIAETLCRTRKHFNIFLLFLVGLGLTSFPFVSTFLFRMFGKTFASLLKSYLGLK